MVSNVNLKYYSIGSIASFIRIYFFGTVTDQIRSKLKKIIFNSYIQKDLYFYENYTSAELISTLDQDTEKASELITNKLAAGLRSLNSAINGSFLLFRTSSMLCGYALILVPIIGK